MDLHVIPPGEDEQETRRIAEVLALAGYGRVGLTFPSGLMLQRGKQLSQLFQDCGIEVATRIDLNSPSRHELLRLLRRFRSLYDVVSVKCVNQNVGMVACRDRRVDLVFFDPLNHRVRLNHTLANLLHGAFEINMSTLISNQLQASVLPRAAKEARIAREHHTKVVISSGCTVPLQARSPMELEALGSALGLTADQSRLGVGQVPADIIERNHFRRSREYIEEGVRLIEPRRR